MRLLARVLDASALLSTIAGGVFIVLMMLNISLDVLAKYLFNHPLPGTFEIASGYYMVALVFLPLVAVSRGAGHIAVEMFSNMLPDRAQVWLAALVALLVGLFTGVFAWASTVEAIDRTIEGEVWQSGLETIIIWPSRWFLPVGLGLMAASALLACLRAVLDGIHEVTASGEAAAERDVGEEVSHGQC